MKNVKRFIALLMAVTLVFSLSVSVFAEALDKTAKYELIVKVLDEEGNVVDSVATGDTIYVAVYFQKKGDSSIVLDIEKNSEISYNVDIPAEVFANRASLEGAYEDEFNGSAGDTKITDWIGDTGCFTIWNTISYSSATTISSDVCIAKHEITAGEIGEYDLVFYEDGTYAKTPTFDASAEFVGTTLTITAAGPVVTPPTFGANNAGADNGVAIEGTNDIYDNAYAVEVTVTPNDAEEVGVLFIPEEVVTHFNDTEWTKAEKATFEGLGKGETTVKAAIINIPRFLEGVPFKMLAKAYAVLGDLTTYGAVSEQTINFADTGSGN